REWTSPPVRCQAAAWLPRRARSSRRDLVHRGPPVRPAPSLRGPQSEWRLDAFGPPGDKHWTFRVRTKAEATAVPAVKREFATSSVKARREVPSRVHVVLPMWRLDRWCLG